MTAWRPFARFTSRHEDRLRAVMTAALSQAVPVSLRELWLHQAVAKIAAQLEDGAELVNLTVVAKCADGFTVAYGMDPGDAEPEQVIVSETVATVGGEQVPALMFTDMTAPDSAAGLEEP